MSKQQKGTWPVVQLKELCARITKGSTPTSYGYQYTTEGIKFIKAENIDSNGIASSTTNYIDSETHQFLKRSILRENDILFSIAGTIGRVGLVRSTELPANTNQALAIIRLKPGTVEPKYLFHFLKSDAILKKAVGQIVGVGRANLSLANIGEFEVPVAPLNHQKRIVAEIEKQFSRLDEAVANLKRVKANLKRYKAAVLKAAVEGKLTEEWRKAHPDVEPASELLKRILAKRRAKWEEAELAKMRARDKVPKNGKWKARYKEPVVPDTTDLPELPEGWMWATTEQIGHVQLGRQRSPKNRSKDYPVKYIRAANITETGLDMEDVLDMEFSLDEQERYRLRRGDLVLSEASGSPDQVGKPAIWQGQLPLCCFQNTVIRLRPAIEMSPYLLSCFLSYYVNGVFAKVAGGVGINHLSAGKFSRVRVPLPPYAEQYHIVAEVDRRLSLICEVEAQVCANHKRAKRLRQAVLQQAFSGTFAFDSYANSNVNESAL